MKSYIPIIGLEIHVELNTKSKMFCQCEANYFNLEPNSNICPVCLGLPGALPVPNKKAIYYAQIIGKALGCKLTTQSKFDRKHYFYPDLPKGYQISQYDEPLAINGLSEISNKKYRITRVHLEEDTGKLIHKENKSLIDFNRSGVPLVEIVTEPDFHSSEEVKTFLEMLHLIIQQYLRVSNANMEQGSMRLEPNISLTNNINRLPDYKIELKNINSFRYVKKAIDYEIERQKKLLNENIKISFETRGYDENKNITFSQRVKEEAKDYRYFPEPDIPVMTFDTDYLNSIKIPELPNEKLKYLTNKYKIRESDAFLLIKSLKKVDFFENISKKITNYCKNNKIEFDYITYQKIVNFIVNSKEQEIESSLVFEKKIIDFLFPKKQNIGITQQIIKNVLNKNKKAVEDYNNGKENVLMYIIGQVLRELKTKQNVNEIKSLILNNLKQLQ